MAQGYSSQPVKDPWLGVGPSAGLGGGGGPEWGSIEVPDYDTLSRIYSGQQTPKVPPPVYGGGGGGGGYGGGGGGGAAGTPPEYWKYLEGQLKSQTGLFEDQETLARRGYGLTKEEANLQIQNMEKMRALQRANALRLLGMQKERVLKHELPAQLQQIGNDAAARSSFMSQARLLGQQRAQTAAQQGLSESETELRGRLAEAKETNVGRAALLRLGVQQAKLQLKEELARLDNAQTQADLEYKIALLRKT